MSKPDITDSIANFLLQDHVDLMRENMALKEAAEMALKFLEELNKLSLAPASIALPGEIDDAMDALKVALQEKST